jgi:carbonic anhydrase
MEINYKNDYEGRGHHCDIFLISCMDFRFHEYLETSLGELLNIQDTAHDFRGVVGGSKAILSSIGRRQAFKAIRLAIKKHGITILVLADHIDCGAYGGSGKFANEVEEEKFHVNQLIKAKKILNHSFPSLNIVLVYQDWGAIKTVS